MKFANILYIYYIIISIFIEICQSNPQRNNVTLTNNLKLINNSQIKLKVALFPFIPDSVNDGFKSLLTFVETQFETAFPNIDLVLRPMNDTDGFYDLPTLSRWLSSSGDGFDMVEIDTVLLGDLVSAGLVAPQTVSSAMIADWHPAVLNSIQYNQAVYGYPHLMCAQFLFTRNREAAEAKTIEQLVAALGNIPTQNYRLVGNLNSSWDLPSLWIDSVQDSGEQFGNLHAFALHSHENTSFNSIRKFAQLCKRMPDGNQCIDGTFREAYDLPAQIFAKNQTPAMFGYSERLFLILRNAKLEHIDDIQIIPVPIGTKYNRPLFTNDVFVFRRNMSARIVDASRKFVEFMASPKIQASFVASGDSPYPNTIPRYLLPVSQSAYDEPLLANDKFYQKYFRGLNGSSQPGLGFYNIRKSLEATILKNIL